MLKLPAIITGGTIAGDLRRDRLLINFSQVNTNAKNQKIKTPVLTDDGLGTHFLGIDAAIAKYNVLISPRPGKRQGIAEDILLQTGGSIFDCVGGIEGYTLKNCGSKSPVQKMGLFYLGGRGGEQPPNKNIRFIGCYGNGAVDEHILRAHNCVDCSAEDCSFLNDLNAPWAFKRGASFNIRDGSGWRLTRCMGSVLVLGPLADGDGGINEKDPKERNRLLSRRLRNTLVEDYQLVDGYVIVEAGVENLTIKGMKGRTPPKHGQTCWISFQKSYGPRGIPQDVTLSDCQIEIRRGETIFTGKAKNLRVDNCQWKYTDEGNSAWKPIDKKTIQRATG